MSNAGVGHSAPAHKEDPADFERVVRINLFGAHFMSHAFARAASSHRGRAGGSIVNVSSVLSLRGSDIPQVAYSASKAGLFGMTRDLASQWARRQGIRVNAPAPGFFMAEMTEALFASGMGRERVMACRPMGRFSDADELVGPMLLLASDAGSCITGTTLSVDSGWSMH